MRTIDFYRLDNGKSPVEEYLGTLSNKEIEKVFLNHAFTKKTQKTPKNDIKKAEQRKKDYFSRS